MDTGSSGTIGRWKVTRSPLFEAAVPAKDCRELVDPAVELPVGDRFGVFGFGLGHPDQGGLVGGARHVPVHAVIAGVEAAADEPPPERRVAGVQDRVPIGVPTQ
jgi:hypothetical protein